MTVDELDPNEYHVLTPPKRRLLVILGIILIVLVIPVLSFFYYDIAIKRPAQDSQEATFVINEGDSVSNVAGRLNEENLVNSAFLFKFYMIVNNLQTDLQAGVYKVPAGISVIELAEVFQHGTDDYAVTFLEGWRVEEFAFEANAHLGKVDFESFVILARDYEGFLFPDTYFFNAEVDETEVLERLTVTFNEKTADLITEEVLTDLDMTREEVVTFASMVEREVFNEDDRPVVAGILINRWRNGELIGADATTQYAIANETMCAYDSDKVEACVPTKDEAAEIDWWPQSITLADLENDSPYNTRKNVGLPPTPIANPGISAIEAVINYEDTEFTYYLTDSEGVTHYGRTLEEHNENIRQHL